MPQRLFVDRGASWPILPWRSPAAGARPGALVPAAAAAGQPGAGGPVGGGHACRRSSGFTASSGCSRTSARARAGGAARGSRRPIRMRFDVAGPFGSGAASAAVIGDPAALGRAARRREEAGAQLSAHVGHVRRRAAARAGRLAPRAGRRRDHDRLAVRQRRPTRSTTCAPPASRAELVAEVRHARQGGRSRRDDARLRRRAAHRPAGRCPACRPSST